MTILRRFWHWLLCPCAHCHRRRLPFQRIRLSGQEYCDGNYACFEAGVEHSVQRHQLGLRDCCEKE